MHVKRQYHLHRNVNPTDLSDNVFQTRWIKKVQNKDAGYTAQIVLSSLNQTLHLLNSL